jgi:hypothetical protein
MIAAQHFAAELRHKDGCHTQTAPFLRFVWKDGMKVRGLSSFCDQRRLEMRASGSMAAMYEWHDHIGQPIVFP